MSKKSIVCVSIDGVRNFEPNYCVLQLRLGRIVDVPETRKLPWGCRSVDSYGLVF